MIDLDKTGYLIATLRKQKKLTQAELAKTLRITPQAVSKWENGLSLPDTVALLKLSRFFKITIDELLKGDLSVKKESNENKNQDITEVFIDGKRKLLSLKPNSTQDSCKNIKYIDNNTVLIEKNGKKFHYILNNSPQNNSELIDLKTRKEYVYNYNSSSKKDKEKNPDTLSIQQLIGMAPFISKKSFNKILDTLEEKNYPVNIILALTPFINSEKINSLTDKMIEKNEIEKISALLPFLSKSKIDNLVKQIDFDNDFKKLEMLLPFIEESTLDNMLSKIEIKKLNPDYFALIAPYLSRNSLDKFLENINIEKNPNILNRTAPYLNEKQLTKLIKKIMNKNLHSKILSIIAPFLNKEQLDRIIDANIDN